MYKMYSVVNKNKELRYSEIIRSKSIKETTYFNISFATVYSLLYTDNKLKFEKSYNT